MWQNPRLNAFANYFLAALSGCIYIAACAPSNLSHLMWVAFIPLFFAIDRTEAEVASNPSITAKSKRWRLFRLGLTTAFFIAATGFYWLIYATQAYGGIPMAASLAVYLAFCFTNQIQVPFFVLARSLVKCTLGPKLHWMLLALLMGVLYAGIESINPKLFADTMGSAFYNASVIRQWADVGGPMIITIFAMMVNELFYQTLKQGQKAWKFAAGAVAALIMINAYGIYRNHEFETLTAAQPKDTPVFRASMIQGNIGDFIKVAAERGEVNAINQVLGEYIKLSTAASEQKPAPDAVIWPETAYPAIYGRPLTIMESKMEMMLNGLIDKTKGYLIFGGYDDDVTHLEYNSVFFIDAQKKEKVVYHKSMLLMFGETLPFVDYFPDMKAWFPTMGFFGRGPGPEVYTLRNALGAEFKIAPSICYEALFVDHSIDGALQGADALLNVTNDSWFGPHGEPYQHLSLTYFRAIETRLPMLRATNTGFTVWVDPTGGLMKSTELFQPGVLTAEIPHRVFPESPYLKISKLLGSLWFAHLVQVLLVGTLLWAYSLTRKNEK